MKRGLCFLGVLVIACFAAPVFSQTAGAKEFKAGMTVAAKWTDGDYYLATIKSINETVYAVDYADGTSGEVTPADILAIPAKPALKKGDKVLAVWSGAHFYAGTVKEVTSAGALVQWNDGSAPSTAEFGKIIKQ